jgi:hypothetical protein
MEVEMKFLYALIQHIWLIVRLKHNGDGMPLQIASATALAFIFIALTLVDKAMHQAMTLESMLSLMFVSVVYVFSLRNTMVGLIITIGIVGNILSIALTALLGVGIEQLLICTLLQYIMIFSAVINVIKTKLKLY